MHSRVLSTFKQVKVFNKVILCSNVVEKKPFLNFSGKPWWPASQREFHQAAAAALTWLCETVPVRTKHRGKNLWVLGRDIHTEGLKNFYCKILYTVAGAYNSDIISRNHGIEILQWFKVCANLCKCLGSQFWTFFERKRYLEGRWD